MALILTPGQLARRAELYYQLGQLTAAGLDLLRSLEQLRRNPPTRSYGPSLQRAIDEIKQGGTLTEGLHKARGWLPEFDITLIQAAEKSGRLDSAFKMLAEYYTERARIANEMVGQLVYPVFLLHFFAFIIHFPALFLSHVTLPQYFTRAFSILGPAYIIAFVVIYAGQNQHAETWRALLEKLLHPIPVLGRARRTLALARLSASLEALISAGVNIIEAWEMAAKASGSPMIRRTVYGWKPSLEAGQTPAELLSRSSVFPELFSNQYASGEISGKLDETLRRLHVYYQEESSRKTRALAKWVPMIIYLVIIYKIASFIIGFYTGYFQQSRDAGGF